MAVTKLTIGSAFIKDDAFAGLEISGGLSAGGNINTNGDLNGGGILLSGNDISAGITTYFHLDPVTDALTIGGQATFDNAPTVPDIKMSNPTGAETCGTFTWSALSPNTISTTAVHSNSIILLTCQSDVPDGTLYVVSINDGVSFDINYTGTGGSQRLYWLIINPS